MVRYGRLGFVTYLQDVGPLEPGVLDIGSPVGHLVGGSVQGPCSSYGAILDREGLHEWQLGYQRLCIASLLLILNLKRKRKEKKAYQ